MSGLGVDLARGDPGEALACSCSGVPLAPGSPAEGVVLAAWVRQQLGEGAEVCVHAGGEVSFAREPGAPRTAVRLTT